MIRIPPKDWSDRFRHAGNKTKEVGVHLQEVVTEVSQVHCCLAGFLFPCSTYVCEVVLPWVAAFLEDLRLASAIVPCKSVSL